MLLTHFGGFFFRPDFYQGFFILKKNFPSERSRSSKSYAQAKHQVARQAQTSSTQSCTPSAKNLLLYLIYIYI
jgi:hypothetical protein